MTGEARLEQIVRMIAGQRSLAEILAVLRREIGFPEAERHVAFLLIDGSKWTLAAGDGMLGKARAALARTSAAKLSEAIFKADPAGADTEERAFDFGWARHLFSGTGEMLGMVLGIEDGPVIPVPKLSARIESVCCLAALAIEHRNMLAELSYRAGHNSFSSLLERARDAEVSTQQVARMIARQCELDETLGALCWELQAAVLLLEDGQWKLAASGSLPPAAEAALARLDAGALSDTMLGAEPAAATPFEAGWARHLYSGTGELLGMLVELAGGPLLPCGLHALRVESVCALAVLAIEQRNLAEDASDFSTGFTEQIRNSADRILALQDLSLVQAEAQSLLAILDVMDAAKTPFGE